MKVLPIILFALLLTTGCSVIPEAEQVFAHQPTVSEVSLFSVMENYTLAPLEIDGHIHLGVHFPIDTDPLANQIPTFEAMVGRHSLYTDTIYLGEPLPEVWLWEMLALGRIPNLILEPTNLSMPFEREPLRAVAQSLGRLRTPMFVQLFPQARTQGYHAPYYIDFWRYARGVFAQYAPQVALVFTVYEGDILDIETFYPGDAYVDWVAINHYVFLADGLAHQQGTLERLEAFYQHFNRYKPLMVNFGVSHFSTQTHRYDGIGAAVVLDYFYYQLLNQFPRVRAVVYQSLDFSTAGTNRNQTDNLSLTGNQHVLSAYTAITGHERFIRHGGAQAHGEGITQTIRSGFMGLDKDGELFVPHYFLLYDMVLGERYLTQYLLPYRQELQGQVFYSVADLERIGFTIAVTPTDTPNRLTALTVSKP